LISKILHTFLLGIIFIPLLYLLLLGVDAGFFKERSLSFFHIFINNKLLNSLKLALLVSISSVLIGLFASLLYYHLRSHKIRNFFLLILFFMFSTAPVIYTSVLSDIEIFNSLNALIKSVIVLAIWLLPLASGIMILMMHNIDESSLVTSRFLPISNFVVFKTIILKQSYFALFGTFTLIFMMAFIQEDVPSFFGYRTYAEEFLSRIILMEKFESTLIYASPFIIFAIASSALLYSMLKKSSWNLFQDQITPLNRLNLISSGKFSYLGVLLFSAIVLFIIFQLLNKVNFSVFTTLLSENIPVLLNSLFLAFCASLIATLLSVYLVNYFNYKSSPSKMIFLISFLSLYWFLPSSLTGLALLKFSQFYYFESEAYEYGMLIYGYVLRVLPIGLVTMLILSQYSSPAHLFKLLKISKQSMFFNIVLPMQWRGWLMVFGILFFLVLNEITTTVLLVPPGFETIIVKIYNLMHYGDFGTVAFLSLLQIALILAGLSLFALVKGTHDRT